MRWLRDGVGHRVGLGGHHIATDGDYAFIEVAGIDAPEAGELRERLRSDLERIPAVRWAWSTRSSATSAPGPPPRSASSIPTASSTPAMSSR